MKHPSNQIDQKKGSADCDVTGSKKGMPGGDIGRSSMSSPNQSGSQSRSAGSKSDYGGSEGNSRERKNSRSGSDSDEG